MDMRTLIALAKEQGWRVEKTKRGHPRFVSPKGDVVVTSGTPSDWRQMKNFVSDLKRRGLNVNRRKKMKNGYSNDEDRKKTVEDIEEELAEAREESRLYRQRYED